MATKTKEELIATDMAQLDELAPSYIKSTEAWALFRTMIQRRLIGMYHEGRISGMQEVQDIFNKHGLLDTPSQESKEVVA